MSDFIPTRVGQVNASGDDHATLRVQFQTEVMAALEAMCVTKDKHTVLPIDQAASLQINATGSASGGYHQPGTQLTGRVIKGAKLGITADYELLSDTLLPKIDEKMTNIDYRAIYVNAQGKFLAKTWDQIILRLFCLNARNTGLVDGQPGGQVLVDTGLASSDPAVSALAFVKQVAAARAGFIRRGIAPADCWLYCTPETVNNCVLQKDAINTLYGGSGSYADGTLVKLFGFTVVETAHLPNGQNLTTSDGILAAGFVNDDGTANTGLVLPKYRGDFTNTVAVIATKEAAVTGQLDGFNTSIDWIAANRAFLIVTACLQGSGTYRAAASAEIKSA